MGQEKKKDVGRGRNKKGRKGEAVRQDYPEDPYYHGLSARVPVFGGREKEMRGQGAPTRQAVSQGHWWQDRIYPSDAQQGKERPPRHRLASPTRPTIFQGAWQWFVTSRWCKTLVRPQVLYPCHGGDRGIPVKSKFEETT